MTPQWHKKTEVITQGARVAVEGFNVGDTPEYIANTEEAKTDSE